MDPPLDYGNPQTLENFLYMVFGRSSAAASTRRPVWPRWCATVIGFAFAQLGPLALVAPIGALVLALRERAVFVLTLTWWLVTWIFALVYVNADIERYYLVPLAVSALWAGIGAGAVWDFVAGALPAVRRAAEPLARVVVGAVAAVVLIVPTAPRRARPLPGGR